MSDTAAKVREFVESPTAWGPWKLQTADGLTLTADDLRALLDRLEAVEAKLARVEAMCEAEEDRAAEVNERTMARFGPPAKGGTWKLGSILATRDLRAILEDPA